MAEEVKYNNTLVSGRADETLSYTRYIKDESSGKSTKELLDEKVNKTDQLGTTQIADNAVTNEKLAEHSVDNSKLSPDSVSYEKIQDGAVITEKIQDKAVTTEKVEEKAITNSKLGDQSVDGRVVREASLESKHFANESVTTEKVARKSITKDKLADNSVDDSQVVDGSIGNAKLSPDSVTTEKIKDSSVTNEKVADDTLGIEKFDPELRKTIQAATGLPDDLSQMIQDVDKSVKQLHEKDTDLQSQIDDKQQQITSNDEDISLLQTRSTQMEKAIKSISASGGASQASAVTYENTESGLESVTAQGAIDELANKKFNKESIAQELGDAEDKVVSQFALPFREIESPEFLHCIVDAEDHFLFGIQLDGFIEWGKGIPAPIRTKLQEITNQCQQDKTNVLEAINAAKEELSASITALQEGKVDKEEGKSLIEDEVKECFRVIENEEFLWAVVDSDDRVLFGFYRATGKPYYPLNEMYHVEQNEEFFTAWLDTDDKVLLGIKRDGQIIGEINAVNALKKVITKMQNDIISLQEKTDKMSPDLQELLSVCSVFSLLDNTEYLSVETDVEGKILSYTNADGSHYIHNVTSETIPTEFDHIEDKEGRLEITVDANGKVLADRKRDGERYETKMNIDSLKVSNFNLKGNSSYDIAKALKEINYNGFDWSDWVEKNSTPLELAIPRKAIVNITGVKNLPSKKAVNDKAYLEYYDLSGNYFKVKVYLNAQGSSTLADPMKSCAIDLFSNDWGEESYEIKFGNWIAQDSFHLKAFYKDALKSIQPISYDIGNQILSYLNVRANRFHIMKTDDILSGACGDTKYDFSQALCMPSQFPVEVYLNGDYYGLFMWSLKKNRDNYSMDKKDYTSILIDNVGSIYHSNGDIGCSWDELKNPKTLICVDGKKYDADTHMGEIIGTDTVAGKKYTFKKLNAATTDFDYFTVTSVDYDALNKDMENTAKTKAIVNECSKYIKYIHDAGTDEEKKKLALKYFDVPNIIAYIIFTELTFNQDGRINNAQITIYDGKVGYNIYDCDSCLGKTWGGVFWSASIVSEIIPAQKDNWMPTDVIKGLFSDEINTCYKKLRDSGIISTENINKIIDSWFDRIGKDALERSIKKWSPPSYRKATNLNVNWEFYICKSLENEDVSQYDESAEYHVGDKVYLKNKTGWDSYYYRCIKDCTGVYPTKNNSLEPNAVYDSFSRIKEWIKYKIEFCDKLFLYNQ